MAEFLFELFSEEIPARMQAKAESDLKGLFTDLLNKESLSFSEIKTFSTPRRVGLWIDGLPTEQADQSEERRGPRADAPEKAVAGFLASVGLKREDLEEREEPKGLFLYAKIEKKGQKTSEVLKAAIPALLSSFPWQKSMKWGAKRQRWVRPLHRILCCFDGQVVDFEFAGITASDRTMGHRFMAEGEIKVQTFQDYSKALENAFVVIDAAKRREIIQNQAQTLTNKSGLNLVEDNALLQEIAGLVEWPVVMLGTFDKAFLKIPHEALVLEMKHHQKYFATTDKNGRLSNHFIFAANLEGDRKAIIKGNERVLGARLADAQFFWDKDREHPLEQSLPQLKQIVFHEKLGALDEKVDRISQLAERIARDIKDCDPKKARRAAQLCKADLVSGMVGEFPELQGVMGGYYAEAQGEDIRVAQAIRDHYSPLGPNDDCPTSPESVAVALADKIDNLVGFFGADLMPTGSKDPFALRRAALGVIRLILENNLRFSLDKLFEVSCGIYGLNESKQGSIMKGLISFFHDRLAVKMREQGVSHDYVNASLQFDGSADMDLTRLASRIGALANFLSTNDGKNLLAGYKRASNIVGIELKKGNAVNGLVNEDLFELAEERILNTEIGKAKEKALPAVREERFEDAMAAIASLRGPIDAFFEKVVVNVDATETRANRLCLLNQINESLHQVADFSMIEN